MKNRHHPIPSVIFAATLFAFATNTLAVQAPSPQAADSRIAVVNYNPNQVVPIEATTFVSTQIVFGKNEVIENVQNGDLSAWTASINKALPYMLFLKPTVNQSHTNMTIVTNKHTYYFDLQSNSAQSNTHLITYALKFDYPNDTLQHNLQTLDYQQHADQTGMNARQSPDAYHWDYSFAGDKTLVPLHVYDDGHFTYFQLQPNQTVPAIFVVDNAAGDESVVNFRQEGQYLIVERTAPQFTLRAGEHHVASIFNNGAIETVNGNAVHEQSGVTTIPATKYDQNAAGNDTALPKPDDAITTPTLTSPETLKKDTKTANNAAAVPSEKNSNNTSDANSTNNTSPAEKIPVEADAETVTTQQTLVQTALPVLPHIVVKQLAKNSNEESDNE